MASLPVDLMHDSHSDLRAADMNLHDCIWELGGGVGDGCTYSPRGVQSDSEHFNCKAAFTGTSI